RAVAMLHSFWYEAAEKSFRAVADADPGCAMAYWGVAMSLYHPIWPDRPPLDKGLAAVEKAKAIGAKTDREKAYIGAITEYYAGAGGPDYKARAQTYEKAMERVYRAFPQDREAAAFYAVALLWTLSYAPADQTNPRKAAAVLDKIADEMPRHPGVLHYYIHAYDSPQLAPLALKAAQSYAKVAPAVPHALHMPSHIFTRLGLWQDSIDSNIASAAAARDYAKKSGMPGAWDQELHALDYLAYAYLQRGDDAKAREVLVRIAEVRSSEPASMVAAYALSAISVRYAVEAHRWEEAARLEPMPAAFPWDRFPIGQAMLRLGRALGLARTGDRAGARKEVDALQSLHDAMPEAGGYNWKEQVEILRREAAGWLAQAEGNPQEAEKLLRSAAQLEDSTEKNAVTPGPITPAREMLGELLLDQKNPGGALIEYEAALRLTPNRFNGLSGAARAAELAGNRVKAKEYYAKLVSVADGGSKRPELAAARTFLARNETAAK
ncbi:MAG TPA: hypothetical protein VGL03_02010, partial [Thermoanaerobaculia bacterium]